MNNVPIRAVVSYETADGKHFTDLQEAKTHTRAGLHLAIYKAAIKTDEKFAHLDKELLVDFLMSFDRQIATVAADQMKPVALPEKIIRGHALANGFELAERPTAQPIAMPKADPIKSAINEEPKTMADVERELDEETERGLQNLHVG